MNQTPAPPPSSQEGFLYYAVLFEAALGFLGLFLGWLADMPLFRQMHWEPLHFLYGTAGALPMALLFYILIIRLPFQPFRRIQILLEQYFLPLFRGASLLDLFLLSLLSGLAEELLFRGFVQGFLAGYLPLWAAVGGAALLFGLAHSVTPLYILLAGVMGVYLGLLYHFTGNLLVPVLVHGIHNFLSFSFYLHRSRKERGGEEQEDGSESETDEGEESEGEEREKDSSDSSRENPRDKKDTD